MLKYGGMSIDITNLTYSEKLTLISRCKILIVEGSGVTNALLFSDISCHVIILSAEETRKEITFALGGWLYSSLFGNRISIVESKGEKSSKQLANWML